MHCDFPTGSVDMLVFYWYLLLPLFLLLLMLQTCLNARSGTPCAQQTLPCLLAAHTQQQEVVQPPSQWQWMAGLLQQAMPLLLPPLQQLPKAALWQQQPSWQLCWCCVCWLLSGWFELNRQLGLARCSNVEQVLQANCYALQTQHVHCLFGCPAVTLEVRNNMLGRDSWYNYCG
jgi:hypothetical protein